GAAGLEEERRLAYVGITRAQKQLCITFAASRQIYGRSVDNLPSRFLIDLPEGLARIQMSLGLDTRSRAGTNRPSQPQPSQAHRNHGQSDSTMAQIRPGDACHHAKFGAGTVLESSGDQLLVRFEDGSEKRIIASYVRARTV
ncbi:MAG: 3'-5' exonuclease, partial [Pseudomonadota bacterium]